MNIHVFGKLLFSLLAVVVTFGVAPQAHAALEEKWSISADAPVTSVTFSRSGDRVAAGAAIQPGRAEERGAQGAVLLLNARTGRMMHKFSPEGDVQALKFTRDEKLLLSISGRYESFGQLSLWNTKTGRLHNRFRNPLPEQFTSLDISPDGKVAACGTFGRIYLVSTTNCAVIRQLMGREGESFDSLAFSPSGTQLIGLSNERSLRMWNVASGNLAHPETSSGSPFGGLLGVYLDSNHILLVQGTAVRMVDSRLESVLRTWKMPDNSTPVPSAENKGNLALTMAQGSPRSRDQPNRHAIQICNWKTGRVVQSLPGHSKRVTALDFSSGGSLVSAGADYQIKLWGPVRRAVS